jgi:hypothetical protein
MSDEIRRVLERTQQLHVWAAFVLGFALGAILCGLIHL